MKICAISLIPPFATVALAMTTKKTRLSLFAGIVLSGLIVSDFSLWFAGTIIIKKLLLITELANLLSWQDFINSRRLFIFFFLLSLGSIIRLIKDSHAALAYACQMRKIAKDKVQIQLYSILLLLMMFVEEDMNILTNSSVLPILTDKFHIARLKIGYLISAIAVPICSIVPLSTWSAVISLFLENSGIGPESTKMLFIGYPFITYLKSIPFSFHSILMIISAIIVVLSKSSFGIIGEHETIAEKKGDLFGGEKPAYLENTDLCKEIDSKEYSFMDFLMPIFCLPVSILCWILYFGDCTVFGGTNGFLDCLENSKIETSLLLGGLTSLFVAFCMSTYKRKVSALDSSKSTLRGMWMMKDSLLTLSLAWTLANFLRTELQTGEFLSLKLMPFISVSFIPIFSFLLAATLSFCIGSSWGSMAIVFPIAIPMLAKMLAVATPISINSFPILYPVIGAIISGALLGSSISPISYLLIMNAKNLEIDHFQLLKSQFQYVLPTAISSLVAFYVSTFPKVAGYWTNVSISLFFGIATYITLIATIQLIEKWFLYKTKA